MGLGKRKYCNSPANQQTKSTIDLTTWRGNEGEGMLSSYREAFQMPRKALAATGINETEPLHVRGNLGLRRKQVRVSSAPPSHKRTLTAPPLLAWNEPDTEFHGKPGVGVRPYGGIDRHTQQTDGYVMETPWARTLEPTHTDQFTISETITPLAVTM